MSSALIFALIIAISADGDLSDNDGNFLGYQYGGDAVSKLLVLGLKGAYTIVRNLDAYGELDYVHIQNPGNVSTNAPIHDLQLTMGISYSL